jgi:hypothetical protein
VQRNLRRISDRSAAGVDGQTAEETPQGRQWLPAREAAKYCGLGFSTMAKLRILGGGPAFSKVGNKVLYNRDDLNKWLASKRVTSTSQLDA